MASKLPTFDRLINPLLRALEALGGSGAVDEIYEKVIELEKLPEDVLAQLHDQDKSNQTEVGYRLAWARTYLKKYGLLENSTRGVWSLTAKAKGVGQVDPQEVLRKVRAQDAKGGEEEDTKKPPEQEEWKRDLHAILPRSSTRRPSSVWSSGFCVNPASSRSRSPAAAAMAASTGAELPASTGS